MITHRSLLAACACLLLLCAASPATRAASPPTAPAPNDACRMCHADKDAKSSAGKAIGVDADRFKGSVHGELGLKCTDCHAGLSPQKLPHAEKIPPVNCATCHDKAAGEYAGTVHGVARKGGNTGQSIMSTIAR